ncbi:MAG: hypothetical protein N7Q72_06130, partial [Spiroplasma sp. Tabriz.8]|nr:hypothetical protein [Spiroplasma sp. Tabriz.8]
YRIKVYLLKNYKTCIDLNPKSFITQKLKKEKEKEKEKEKGKGGLQLVSVVKKITTIILK